MSRLLLVLTFVGRAFQVSAPEKARLVWKRSMRERGLIRFKDPYLGVALRNRDSRYLGASLFRILKLRQLC